MTNENNVGPGALERSGNLFKRGFELSDSISPGTYPARRDFKDKICRSCFRRFTPDLERGGQHVCPHCHGDQKA